MNYTSEKIVQELAKMLKPENDPQIPEKTIKDAKVAFPNGNIYLARRDTLGHIF
jgi:hypothetical protein